MKKLISLFILILLFHSNIKISIGMNPSVDFDGKEQGVRWQLTLSHLKEELDLPFDPEEHLIDLARQEKIAFEKLHGRKKEREDVLAFNLVCGSFSVCVKKKGEEAAAKGIWTQTMSIGKNGILSFFATEEQLLEDIEALGKNHIYVESLIQDRTITLFMYFLLMNTFYQVLDLV